MSALCLPTSSLCRTPFPYPFLTRSSLFDLSSSIPSAGGYGVLFCPLHLNSSSLSSFCTHRTSRPFVCRASTPPPDSGPPPENHTDRNSGVGAFFSRLQNRVQVFVAVLFWMSLFFWTSAWDGKNRSDEGPRFRR